jgi:putative heme-binding domain-containing protein
VIIQLHHLVPEEVAMHQRPGVLLFLALLLLPVDLAATQERALGTADQIELSAGKKIFDAQCAWCHGADGAGGMGSTLQGTKLRHAADDAALLAIVRNGIPGTEMPSFVISLTNQTAWQTAAYVRSLGRLAPQHVPGSPERGQSLYQSKGCGSCHIVAGRGIHLGPELTTIGALRGPSSLRESLIAPEAAHSPAFLVVRAKTQRGDEVRGIRVNEDVFWVHIRDGAGVLHRLAKKDLASLERELRASLMPSYQSMLSSGELDDLVAYLASLRGAR